ncbi:MAG: hypothetical protein Q8908_06010, partial [Bacteroidota bacterium]|nr:hypothetical protein [Bacteroidota bacterium]
SGAYPIHIRSISEYSYTVNTGYVPDMYRICSGLKAKVGHGLGPEKAEDQRRAPLSSVRVASGFHLLQKNHRC